MEQVDEAHSLLDKALTQHEREQEELAAGERELSKEHRAVETRHAKELRLLNDRLDAERQDYEARLGAWHKAMKSRAN